MGELKGAVAMNAFTETIYEAESFANLTFTDVDLSNKEFSRCGFADCNTNGSRQ